MFKQEKKYYQKAFFVTAIMAFAMFLPFVIVDGGYFIYYGDYNAQQIPFFKHCVDMVRSGNFGWDWKTDLGANFIGNYTYYTLGSPFFWFMCLFPSSVTPYLMMPMQCVKFGLFGLFAFIYIRRFVNKPQSALVGGILYAFSGFNLYNIFFQFQDAMIWFPLLLIALEEAVINKRRGVFAIAMAVNCLANYFFFIQECIFLILYFAVRCASDSAFRIRVRDFFCLAFECVVGVLIAGVLFFPSIYQVLDTPRSMDMLTGWDLLFFEERQRYGFLLENIFFPPELPSQSIMFPGSNAEWASVAIYLPLFSMAGVLAFFKSTKKHWIKPLLLLCLFFALVPGLNASFTMFNSFYYTRWFYMPTLICCLATAGVLDREDSDLKFGVTATTAATAVIAVLAMAIPFVSETTDSDGVTTSRVLPRFVVSEFGVLWNAIGLAAVSILVLWILLRYRKKESGEKFISRVTGLTIAFSMLLGYYFIGFGRVEGPSRGSFNKAVSAKFDIDDPEFYRIEGLDETFNVNMLWDMGSIKSFTSVIPSSTIEMYELIGETRRIYSIPTINKYGLRALTRVKYVMVPKDKTHPEIELDLMEIYEKFDEQGEYYIYKTDYALPMGFAYDEYYLADDVKGTHKIDNLMVRGAFLTEEQAGKYSDILEALDVSTTENISLEEFKEDAKARIAEGVTQFAINKKGFTAVSDYETEKLVCFSVPWDEGWSATVNGEPVEVDKINGGFCAIRVPKGVGEISFTYRTPWLGYGIIASLGGIVLLTAYMLFFKFIRKKAITEERE